MGLKRIPLRSAWTSWTHSILGRKKKNYTNDNDNDSMHMTEGGVSLLPILLGGAQCPMPPGVVVEG